MPNNLPFSYAGPSLVVVRPVPYQLTTKIKVQMRKAFLKKSYHLLFTGSRENEADLALLDNINWSLVPC